MYLSALHVIEVFGASLSRFASGIVFDVTLPAHGVARFRRCIDVANDKFNDVLAIYVGVQGFFLVCSLPYFCCVRVPFRAPACVYSVSPLIHVHCIIDYIVHDENDFRSDDYRSLRPQSRGTGFRLALGG